MQRTLQVLRALRRQTLFTVITSAVVLTAIAFTGAFALHVQSTQASGSSAQLADARAATARYNDLGQAKASNYGLFLDRAGIACIDNPGVGAMGIHYLNGGLVGAVAQSGTFDPLKPQALVYEPGEQGQSNLVAVEYLVFQKDWEAVHGVGATPPELFGQHFMLVPANNRFSPDAIYALHVWIWQDNPDGTFAMWNPTVHCPAA
jgi:hypothetical protein